MVLLVMVEVLIKSFIVSQPVIQQSPDISILESTSYMYIVDSSSSRVDSCRSILVINSVSTSYQQCLYQLYSRVYQFHSRRLVDPQQQFYTHSSIVNLSSSIVDYISYIIVFSSSIVDYISYIIVFSRSIVDPNAQQLSLLWH